jgi:hypothetical protein
MHVTAVLDAIKKRGHVKDYKMAVKEYEGAKKAVESAIAGPALLDGTREKGKKSQKKETKEGKKDATGKAPESESDAREAKVAPTVNDKMKASFLEDLEKAKQAQRTVKGVMTVAASKMFSFYSNLLSPESKYAWNKIVSEQMESDPYVNLQGDSLEGPRGMSRASFNDCMMFHLLTSFPINAAEQEKYYISNVLKKPLQCTSVCTSCRAAQRLHCSDAVLLLQPTCKCQHQTREHFFHGG